LSLQTNSFYGSVKIYFMVSQISQNSQKEQCLGRPDPQSERGFTLVEVLLYLAISSIILGIISFFVFMMLETRVKNQTILEVEQQGLFVMQTISRTIRNAESINSPSVGASADSLSLSVFDALDNPTIFDVAGGSIRVKEGVAVPIALTSPRVVINNLTFYNLSRPGTPGVIRIMLNLRSYNPNGKNEYEFVKIFTASASLR